MKKVWLIGIGVMTIAVGALAKDTSAMADNASKKDVAKAEAKQAPLQEMTITGVIDKVEKKKKDGSVMMTWYRLIDEDCRDVRVPKGEVEKFVGAKVKVTGMGYTLEKRGKTTRAFKTITAIEKLADAPTPATPAK